MGCVLLAYCDIKHTVETSGLAYEFGAQCTVSRNGLLFMNSLFDVGFATYHERSKICAEISLVQLLIILHLFIFFEFFSSFMSLDHLETLPSKFLPQNWSIHVRKICSMEQIELKPKHLQNLVLIKSILQTLGL